MNLKQKTISEIMLEAGKKIAAVDQYNGLIAECESLAERLNEAASKLGFQFSPLICAHESGTVSAWISVAFERRSTIYSAIRAAGLEIAGESASKIFQACVDIHLEGLDVPVTTTDIAAEVVDLEQHTLAEAA